MDKFLIVSSQKETDTDDVKEYLLRHNELELYILEKAKEAMLTEVRELK